MKSRDVNERVAVLVSAVAVLAHIHAASGLQTPAPPGAPADRPLIVISRDETRTIPITLIGSEEMVGLADLANLFQFTVREDNVAGGLVVTYKDQTIVLSASEGLASAGGRVVSLPSPPVRRGGRWLVPIGFIGRALARVYDLRLEVRRGSRLVLLGDVRVPRVEVGVESAGGQARLVLDIAPPTAHTINQTRDQLLVRFDADRLDVGPAPRLPQELVSGIRPSEDEAVLGIDLGPRFGAFRSSVLAGDRRSRLVIDLVPASTSLENRPTTPDTERVPTLPNLTPASALRTIVIDPGHGGEEDGARGPSGTLEKHVTLGVARRLKSAIENRLGLRVILTRDEDDTVRLDERAAIANNNKADLFISLHANASVRSSAAGAEVFYLSIDEYGDEGRRLAAAEGQELPVVGGGTRAIEIILWEMAQVRHLEQSAVLAQMVEAQLRPRLLVSPRAIQQAPFRVLVGANMPAVLVEMGFISNPDQERQLASEAFQQAVTQALVEAILGFRDFLQNQVEPGRRALPVELANGDR